MKTCTTGLIPLVMTCSAFAGVVIQMPPPPPSPQMPAATTLQVTTVTPLERFAKGDPARDRAGQVLTLHSPEAQSVYLNRWRGVGWQGRAWGWGSPIIINNYGSQPPGICGIPACIQTSGFSFGTEVGFRF